MQEQQDVGQDRSSSESAKGTLALQAPHDAEAASEVAAAVVAHQQVSSDSGRGRSLYPLCAHVQPGQHVMTWAPVLKPQDTL